MSFLSLTILVFAPIIAALFIACPWFSGDESRVRKFSIGFSAVLFIYSLLFLFKYNPLETGLQFVETLRLPGGSWIESMGINFSLGIDGISLILVVLTTFLVFLACIASKGSIAKNHKFYYSMIFTLTTAILGVFTSKDLFLFFLFWELELIPMYFLISIWGSGRKEYSATKFVLYTFTGSIFMLASILAVYFYNHAQTGIYTFDLSTLISHSYTYPLMYELLVFWGFFIGFAVKLPVVPLHTWLPDAHVDAPTPVSMLLAGILLKMGGYGLVRMNFQMLHEAFNIVAPVLVILGLINLIYAAIITFAQDDLKKLVAYSSVSHMGIVLIGLGALNTIGLTGAIFQMFAHGVISAGLFMMVGVIYIRTKTRSIKELSGIGQLAPKMFYSSMAIALASLGLPLFIGFAAEVMAFIGAFTSKIATPISMQYLTIIAIFGIILTASYLLWMLKRVFFGPVSEKVNNLSDLNLGEIVVFASLILVIVAFGVYPSAVTNVFVPTISAVISK